MRKLAIILVSALLLTACAKDEKRCWGCRLVFSDGFVASYRDSMICDKTQTEINAMRGRIYDARALGYRTYEVNACSRIR